MHAQIAVDGGAVETEVDAEGHGGPGGVFGAAVEADFIRSGGAAEFVEEGLRGGFGGEVGHCCGVGGKGEWCWGDVVLFPEIESCIAGPCAESEMRRVLAVIGWASSDEHHMSARANQDSGEEIAESVRNLSAITIQS